jgi:hypothetical protein
LHSTFWSGGAVYPDDGPEGILVPVQPFLTFQENPMRKRFLLVPLAMLLLTGATIADDLDDVTVPTVPYTSGGQARFFPVAKDLIVPAGERVSQVLNVFNMERVSVQAVADSTQGDGNLVIRVGFGPPLVGDPAAKLELSFLDSDKARGSSTTLVKGPRMAVVIRNDRAVPVKVTVGAYATN